MLVLCRVCGSGNRGVKEDQEEENKEGSGGTVGFLGVRVFLTGQRHRSSWDAPDDRPRR